MTENLATQFVEENGYPMHVFRSSSFAMHAIPKALWLPVFASCPVFLSSQFLYKMSAEKKAKRIGVTRSMSTK